MYKQFALDHRDLGADLGIQRAVADACALRHAPQAPEADAWTAGRLSSAASTRCSTSYDSGYVKTSQHPRAQRRSCRSRSWGWWCWVQVFLGGKIPAGFVPEEDQGIVGRRSSTSARCVYRAHERGNEEGGSDRRENSRRWTPTRRLSAYGVVTSTYQPNYGTIFMRLKPWEERKDHKDEGKGHHGVAAEASLPPFRRRSFSRSTSRRLAGFWCLRGIQFPAAGSQRLA